MKWEYFRDNSYYDLWAVRPVGENRWGYCFHVQTQEEAEGLRDLLSERIDDKLQCLVGALEKIADFGKVCFGPGCPYCEQEGDLEPQHPPSWEAKEAQKALELAGIRYSANACDKRRSFTASAQVDCSVSLVAQPPRDVSELHHELLYAVARKFPGESRHETALRYIRDAEERASGTGSCKQNAGAVPRRGSDVGTSPLLGVS